MNVFGTIDTNVKKNISVTGAKFFVLLEAKMREKNCKNVFDWIQNVLFFLNL